MSPRLADPKLRRRKSPSTGAGAGAAFCFILSMVFTGFSHCAVMLVELLLLALLFLGSSLELLLIFVLNALFRSILFEKVASWLRSARGLCKMWVLWFLG